jgi:hypothetical protein
MERCVLSLSNVLYICCMYFSSHMKHMPLKLQSYSGIPRIFFFGGGGGGGATNLAEARGQREQGLGVVAP